MLLTKQNKNDLPAMYSQDGKGDNAKAVVKFFAPDSSWTWYAVEGYPVLDDTGREVDYEFFGLVDGFDAELGYFRLSELKKARGQLGLPVERDRYFRPITLGEVRAKYVAAR